MSKRWFTPSFEPSATTSTSAEQVISSKQQQQQRRRKTGGRGTQRRTVRADGAVGVGVDILARYQPETPDDLVVHAKKIDQVRAWISDRIANSVRAGAGADADGKYVLLQGPSGSGKSTTFRVLAKSLNVKIIEWITPLDREWLPDHDADCDGDGDDDGRYFRSGGGGGGGESLDNFLWRASRYGCLTGTVDGRQPCLKIILVKDFPHSFVQNAQSFHDLLRKYRDYNTYPMAFVCNDDAVSRRLFPDSIRSECGVHAIVFNAVNCTAVTKALKRVLEMERRLNPALVASLPGQVNLQTFHQQSAGDLRCALLNFYFSIIKPSPSPMDTVTAIADSDAPASATATTTATVNDRRGLDLFKILGRVLYCKTEYSAADDDYKFVHDADALAKSMSDQPSLFTAFLQENYVSRFQDMMGVAAVADTFCVADAVFQQRCCYKNTTSEAIALNNVVRRLMVCNRRPKKSFAPFVKPKIYDTAETFAARFSRSLRGVSPHSQFSSRELVLHVLPYAGAIPSPSSHHIRQCLQQLATADGYSLSVKRES